MDNKTITKHVIQTSNDKFLRFGPNGITECDDPISATIYSTPGKANRRLTSLQDDEEFSTATLVAIDFTWAYSVPEDTDIENQEEEEVEAFTDPT